MPGGPSARHSFFKNQSGMDITPVSNLEQLTQARELFQEYGELLRGGHGACCLVSFQSEIDGLPGEYAPPGGNLLLASDGGSTSGCVALRKIGPNIGEMKRLYVRPRFRGLGIGRALTDAVIALARRSQYAAIRLDTLPSMLEAAALYESMGFNRIAPYGDFHPPGAVCMELDLT